MSTGTMERGAEVAYVATTTVLAVLGAVHEKAVYFLVAIALTLPLGLAAAVTIYAGYALIAGLGGLFAPTTGPDGNEALWLSSGSAALDITVLCAAALGNVLLLHRIRRRRRPGRARL